jgi:hypothetical protein
MSDQFWLTKAQLKRIEPFFPRTRGIPRVDDRRVVSGIVHGSDYATTLRICRELGSCPLRILRPLAEQGMADALYVLGLMYTFGQGVTLAMLWESFSQNWTRLRLPVQSETFHKM